MSDSAFVTTRDHKKFQEHADTVCKYLRDCISSQIYKSALYLVHKQTVDQLWDADFYKTFEYLLSLHLVAYSDGAKTSSLDEAWTRKMCALYRDCKCLEQEYASTNSGDDYDRGDNDGRQHGDDDDGEQCDSDIRPFAPSYIVQKKYGLWVQMIQKVHDKKINLSEESDYDLFNWHRKNLKSLLEDVYYIARQIPQKVAKAHIDITDSRRQSLMENCAKAWMRVHLISCSRDFQDILRVAFVGTESIGKSTLINFLCNPDGNGNDLVPTGERTTTVSACFLRASRSNQTQVFYDDEACENLADENSERKGEEGPASAATVIQGHKVTKDNKSRIADSKADAYGGFAEELKPKSFRVEAPWSVMNHLVPKCEIEFIDVPGIREKTVFDTCLALGAATGIVICINDSLKTFKENMQKDMVKGGYKNLFEIRARVTTTDSHITTDSSGPSLNILLAITKTERPGPPAESRMNDLKNLAIEHFQGANIQVMYAGFHQMRASEARGADTKNARIKLAQKIFDAFFGWGKSGALHDFGQVLTPIKNEVDILASALVHNGQKAPIHQRAIQTKLGHLLKTHVEKGEKPELPNMEEVYQGIERRIQKYEKYVQTKLDDEKRKRTETANKALKSVVYGKGLQFAVSCMTVLLDALSPIAQKPVVSFKDIFDMQSKQRKPMALPGSDQFLPPAPLTTTQHKRSSKTPLSELYVQYCFSMSLESHPPITPIGPYTSPPDLGKKHDAASSYATSCRRWQKPLNIHCSPESMYWFLIGYLVSPIRVCWFVRFNPKAKFEKLDYKFPDAGELYPSSRVYSEPYSKFKACVETLKSNLSELKLRTLSPGDEVIRCHMERARSVCNALEDGGVVGPLPPFISELFFYFIDMLHARFLDFNGEKIVFSRFAQLVVQNQHDLIAEGIGTASDVMGYVQTNVEQEMYRKHHEGNNASLTQGQTLIETLRSIEEVEDLFRSARDRKLIRQRELEDIQKLSGAIISSASKLQIKRMDDTVILIIIERGTYELGKFVSDLKAKLHQTGKRYVVLFKEYEGDSIENYIRDGRKPHMVVYFRSSSVYSASPQDNENELMKILAQITELGAVIWFHPKKAPSFFMSNQDAPSRLVVDAHLSEHVGDLGREMVMGEEDIEAVRDFQRAEVRDPDVPISMSNQDAPIRLVVDAHLSEYVGGFAREMVMGEEDIEAVRDFQRAEVRDPDVPISMSNQDIEIDISMEDNHASTCKGAEEDDGWRIGLPDVFVDHVQFEYDSGEGNEIETLFISDDNCETIESIINTARSVHQHCDAKISKIAAKLKNNVDILKRKAENCKQVLLINEQKADLPVALDNMFQGFRHEIREGLGYEITNEGNMTNMGPILKAVTIAIKEYTNGALLSLWLPEKPFWKDLLSTSLSGGTVHNVNVVEHLDEDSLCRIVGEIILGQCVGYCDLLADLYYPYLEGFLKKIAAKFHCPVDNLFKPSKKTDAQHENNDGANEEEIDDDFNTFQKPLFSRKAFKSMLIGRVYHEVSPLLDSTVAQKFMERGDDDSFVWRHRDLEREYEDFLLKLEKGRGTGGCCSIQ